MLCAVDYIFNLLCAFNSLQPMKKFVFSVASRATARLQIKPSGSGDENERSIAVKIKGTEDFVAWQKAVGIFKVLVITKFTNYLQRPNSTFCSSDNGFGFLSMFIMS